ncbi:MAG: hypothetical protein BWY06_02191 [Candidatus Latescibacteria bacterium ADurb.Bin168]|nr:MAG: hypothetical protein BWY06_02191 [Candidatus Latescibacteria bacterium ADurb.Bin168]
MYQTGTAGWNPRYCSKRPDTCTGGVIATSDMVSLLITRIRPPMPRRRERLRVRLPDLRNRPFPDVNRNIVRLRWPGR